MIKMTLILFLSGFFFGNARPQNMPHSNGMDSVTLFSNGYVYPNSESRRFNNISREGLHRWNDPDVFTRTFFYPQITGSIDVAIFTRSPDGSAKLTAQLDGTGKKYTFSVTKSSDFIRIPVGTFTIKDARYHYVEIRGISKTGSFFPDIQSLLVGGAASANLEYNLSEYKGAPSTHLWYDYPKDSTVAWFYNEVTVPEGVDATNAYYMTNGFSGGYMGIQLNSKTERRIIFSVWSNFSTNDPKEIPADYAVTLVHKGKDVFTGEFGNEGSGGHSHLEFTWKQGVTYKMLLGAKSAGDHTIYSAYYFAPENGKWNLMATWDKTKTGGKLLSGLYSFVENFGPNGNDFFKAEYGNQWICTASGIWIELTRCSLTTTASPAKHQRYDYGAGVEHNWFYMFTGGFREMNNLAPHSTIDRKPNGVPPHINFAELPEK
jgi:hypothetical protein